MIEKIRNLFSTNEMQYDITNEDVTRRAQEGFANIYFVGLGLFQSIIATRLFEAVYEMINKDNITYLIIDHIIVCFLFFSYVLYSYWWWISFIRRWPNVFDIWIPFVLGFFQFGQIISLNSVSKWNLYTGLFCVFAIFALSYTYSGLKKVTLKGNNFDPIEFKRILLHVWFKPVIVSAAIGGVIGVLGYVCTELKNHLSYFLIVPAIGYGVFELRFLRKLRLMINPN